MMRSGRIVVVSHCILNVHCLEDNLAEYAGLEEDVLKLLISKEVGIFQIPCPEMDLQGIFRKPLPKDSYDNVKIRNHYRKMVKSIVNHLLWFDEKGYEIVAILGADGSPTCGISKVGKWKNVKGKKEFPKDVEFVKGVGVFMEELQKELAKVKINTKWIGIPGKSLKSRNPEIFEKTLTKIEELI